MPSRVRLPADRPGHGPVQRQPLGHLRLLGVPEEPAVVSVPRRDQPAGSAHPAHLPQRRDRVGQVLEHLVRVHHVERAVREVQVVHVPGVEPDVVQPSPLRLLPGLRQHVGGRVDGGHVPAGHPGRQVRGDRARAAAHVEHARVRREPRQQVPRRVLRGAPAVRPQHAVVMAVQVGVGARWHGPIMTPVHSVEQICPICGLRLGTASVRWCTGGRSGWSSGTSRPGAGPRASAGLA